MTWPSCPGWRSSSGLQFGHAQRAWDDVRKSSINFGGAFGLQFGHAKRAWDDISHLRMLTVRGLSFNSATPRGRGMTQVS